MSGMRVAGLVLILAGVAAAVMGLTTMAAEPSSATAPAGIVLVAATQDTCSCGAPAVDSGLCAECIEVPNEVHEPCGYRHMQPYPGGTCPRP